MGCGTQERVGKVDEHARQRAERRAFIRANHPDRGGDPQAFIAGLSAMNAGRPFIAGLSAMNAGRPDEGYPPARVVVRPAVPLPHRVLRGIRRRLRPAPPRVR
ncbi:MAG: hypothetical protein ACR2LF_02665 [Jatrophihabitantaceae bacterium]